MTISAGVDFPLLQDLITDPIERLKGVTPGDYLALRDDVIAIIQGGVAPAGSKAVTALNTGAWTLPLTNTPYAQDFVLMGMDGGVSSKAIYIRHATGNGRLFGYCQGHGGGYIPFFGDTRTNADYYYTAGTKALLEAVYAHGDDLLLFCPPGVGENYSNFVTLGLTNHNDFATFKPSHGSPIRWFTDPISRGIDHAQSVRSYTDISIAGISGGGYTALLAAAIDNRIKLAYSIAGWLPLYLRHTDLGDWEQWQATELWSQFEYLDLLLMNVAESDRRSSHLYHQHDTCCFEAASIIPFAKDMRRYARENGFGKVQFAIDPIFVGHDVSDFDRQWILSDLYP